MENAEIVARLEEVVKTLEKVKRSAFYRKAYWNARQRRREAAGLSPDVTAYYRKIVDAKNAEYDAIVARIAAVRLAIERLSQ